MTNEGARPELVRKLKDKMKDKQDLRQIKLPSGIVYLEDGDNRIRMKLSRKAIGLLKGGEKAVNMQDDAAAFEGWAAILYAHLGLEIILDVQDGVELPVISPETPPEEYLLGKHGHFSRFLYRAQKFKEEYDWFSLAPSLESVVRQFSAWLDQLARDGELIQSAPKGAAGDNGEPENQVEQAFANKGVAFLFSGEEISFDEVYRQLPVGLFQAEVSKGSRIFTGGKSAIDLWSIEGDSLAIFELKTDNKMVGIITELFFYANYMYDLCITRRFLPSPGKRGQEKARGYDTLRDACEKRKIKNIYAYMLTDELHPLITEKVIDALESNGKEIHYGSLHYTYEMELSKLE